MVGKVPRCLDYDMAYYYLSLLLWLLAVLGLFPPSLPSLASQHLTIQQAAAAAAFYAAGAADADTRDKSLHAALLSAAAAANCTSYARMKSNLRMTNLSDRKKEDKDEQH